MVTTTEGVATTMAAERPVVELPPPPELPEGFRTWVGFQLDKGENYPPIVVTGAFDRVHLHLSARIDSFVKIEGGVYVRIGRWVHVASFAHLNIGGGELYLEDGAAVASGAKLVTGGNVETARSMSAKAPSDFQGRMHGAVILGPWSCVLTNAVVLPGVTLFEGAMLGAGSVATRDIPPWEVWAGAPARFLRRRRQEQRVPPLA